MNKKIQRILSFTVLIFSLPNLVLAANIDYSNIISDAEAENYQSMNQVQIRNFLQSKNSTLANYWYTGYNPSPFEEIIPEDQRTTADYKQRSAVEIIYNAAWEAQINPQFLLTMLQKEMSLIEDPEPTERQYAFAMGYYCFDGQSCNPRWRGFGKQVRATALQFRDYLDNIESRAYQTGKTFVIEGQSITPANNVTAGLYNYTPHLHGNSLFKTIWDRYEFGGETTEEIILNGGIIPEGSLVRARDGEDLETIFLIHNNQKQPFASNAALVSRYHLDQVLNVPSAELEKFPLGASINYPAYSILMAPNGNKYLLDGLEKRLIANDEVFRNLGFNPAEVEEVSSEELASIEDGQIIEDPSLSPVAQLLRDTSTGGVYYAKDGKKYPIVDPEIISINYPDLKIVNATTIQLDQLQKVSSAKISDGTLLISDESNQVYVIANGKRRWIVDQETFEGLGYSWSNIKKVSDRVLKLHQVGEPISL
ncbi:hypothetical protein H6761_01260 [Candidatus Nomurabacteria bacterium]|nr:hypothetical protein [Candidatus Nomurabacteria bacterium]